MNEHFAYAKFYRKSNIRYEYFIRRMEMKCYLRTFLKSRDRCHNRFVIFAQNRTGSHLLTDLLNSHPEIKCEEEIFNPFKKLKIKKVLSPYHYILGRSPIYMTNYYGFNLKLDHLHHSLTPIHGNPERFLFNLYKKGWKVIYVERLNKLLQSISWVTGRIRNKWQDTPRTPLVRSKVNIECDSLIETIKWFEKLTEEEHQILDGIPHVTITYENDLLNEKDHQKTANSIFNYFGLSKSVVKARRKRISSDRLSDEIENYEEVVEFISKTNYASFLNEN